MSEHAPCPDCIEHPGWNNATAPNGSGTTRDYCKACLGSGRDIVTNAERLRSLPIGTTMIDRHGVRLVKVDPKLYASDADLGSNPDGWAYFDEDEILGLYADPAEPWLPATVNHRPTNA